MVNAISDSSDGLPEIQTALKKLSLFIVEIQEAFNNSSISSMRIDYIQRELDKFNELFNINNYYQTSNRNLFVPMELQGLIYFAQNNDEKAELLLNEALGWMTDNERFISTAAQGWYLDKKSTENIENQYSGKIEGWLSLYALTFILAPVIILRDLILTNNITSQYSQDPFLSKLFLAAIIFDVTSLLFLAFFGYCFFTKKKITRVLAIIFSSYVIIASIGIYIALYNYVSNNGGNTSDLNGSMMTPGTVVWLFYWMFSKRVKSTFVRIFDLSFFYR